MNVIQYRNECWTACRDAIGKDDVLIRMYRFVRDYNDPVQLEYRLKEYARLFFPVHVLKKKEIPQSKVIDHGKEPGEIEWKFYLAGVKGYQGSDVKGELEKEYLKYCALNFPNLFSVLDSMTGTVLEVSSGLKRLAVMTQKSIEELGNEKAKFLGKPGRGVLWRHGEVEDKKSLRKLAGEIMKASRKDFFSEKK